MAKQSKIILTSQDFDRLEALLASLPANAFPGKAALQAELERAEIVEPEKVPPDVVTMNSKVRFIDLDSDEERIVTLVYPKDADPAESKVSVLAPVGAALLGLSVGQCIDWPMPGGRVKRLKIAEVLYQPEAAGDYDL